MASRTSRNPTSLDTSKCARWALIAAVAVAPLVRSRTANAQAWTDATLSPEARARLVVVAMTAEEKLAMVHGTAGVALPPAVVVAGGIYGLQSRANPGSCIDVKGAGTINGTPVQEYACNGSIAQIFTARDAGNGAFMLVNGADKCIDIPGGDASTANRAQLYDCNNGPGQSFVLKRNADGTVSIVNTGSNKCLEVAGADAANETPIQLNDCNATNGQLFTPLEPQYVGNVPAIPRLGIPALRLHDGPAGVAAGAGQVTAFPAPINIAATWDVDVARRFGAATALEEAKKGVNVQLSPMMNIDRVPQGGRNFEGFGEDPYLASRIAEAVVRGIQSQGIIATAKHYIDNDHETDRGSVSVVIDDRTQHEIYLPPFKASVEAGVGAIMCSYNRVNGTYACENGPTQNGWLKGELGFRGFIMSDWGATHSTAASAIGGLDMEMPGAWFFGGSLASAITAGTVPQSRVDDMVTRILTSMFQAGLFDRAPSGSLIAKAATDAATELTRTAASEGMVLLKNTGAILPLDPKTVQSIAVIGDAADLAPIAQGGGSSYVRLPYLVTPRQGIATRAGAGIAVRYAASSDPTAPAVAQASDVAVVVVGVTSGEGGDRPTLSFASTDDSLVSAVVAANPRTVVVAYAPAQVLMPWAAQTPAILLGLLPGQEEGNALAAVLFGDVNPCGKLPMTIASAVSDYPASTAAQFPGAGGSAQYNEGLLVGYRHFDANKIAPLFPFGHGLSYSTFEYANLTVAPGTIDAPNEVTATLDVTNSGAVAGSEVVQLYLGLPPETSEPPAQLQGFVKVKLAPKASEHVTFHIPASAYSFWSAGAGRWLAYPGIHLVAVGSSSRDLRLRGAFVLHGGPLSGTIYQAETASLSGGATIATDAAGYTGAGYVAGFAAIGAKTTFTVTAPSAGRLPVTLRYSTVKEPRTLSVYVNGTKAGQTRLPNLANGATWDFRTEPLLLGAGENTIAYAFDQGDTGQVAIDALILGSADDLPDGGIDAGACDGGACNGSIDASADAPPLQADSSVEASACTGATCAAGASAPAEDSASGCACGVAGRGGRDRLPSALVLLLALFLFGSRRKSADLA
jgi:beta-glucosidase